MVWFKIHPKPSHFQTILISFFLLRNKYFQTISTEKPVFPPKVIKSMKSLAVFNALSNGINYVYYSFQKSTLFTFFFFFNLFFFCSVISTFGYKLYMFRLSITFFFFLKRCRVLQIGPGGYSTLVWVGVCRWDFWNATHPCTHFEGKVTHPCTKNQNFSLKFAPFWRKFRKIL